MTAANDNVKLKSKNSYFSTITRLEVTVLRLCLCTFTLFSTRLSWPRLVLIVEILLVGVLFCIIVTAGSLISILYSIFTRQCFSVRWISNTSTFRYFHEIILVFCFLRWRNLFLVYFTVTKFELNTYDFVMSYFFVIELLENQLVRVSTVIFLRRFCRNRSKCQPPIVIILLKPVEVKYTSLHICDQAIPTPWTIILQNMQIRTQR